MADGMSFDKYIDNPSGGSSVITNRQMYKAMYQQKFDTVLLRENGEIKFKVYHSNDRFDSYYIHIKVPSEVIEKFYYDVVIRLYTTSMPKKASKSLRIYAVQFFSNDPAFVYTFAHSFLKNKIFIEDLKPRMMKKALTDVAKERNPKDNVWYVKSLYFAYLTMEKYSLFNRTNLNMVAQPYDKNYLLRQIEPAEKKVKARQDAQEKLNRERREAKSKEVRDYNSSANQGIKTKSSGSIIKTKSVNSVKKVGSTKTVKRSKHL